MPLVRGGRIAADNFTRIEDGAPIPEEGAVLVPAARFLADVEELTRRSAPTGVLWPNDRNVTELAPYLDKLALVALVFPTFKDGRAYSQARLLRERLRRPAVETAGDHLPGRLHCRRELVRGPRVGQVILPAGRVALERQATRERVKRRRAESI